MYFNVVVIVDVPSNVKMLVVLSALRALLGDAGGSKVNDSVVLDARGAVCGYVILVVLLFEYDL